MTAIISPENRDLFSSIIGTMLLKEPSQEFVFHQELTVKEEIGKNEGDTIRLNRYPYLPEAGLDEASRTIEPSQTIGTNNGVRLTADHVYINLKRFAGPYNEDEAAVAPLTVDEVSMRYAQTVISQIDWDDALARRKSATSLWDGIGGQRLKRDHDLWEDKVIQTLLGTVSNTYNATGVADGSVNAQKFLPSQDLAELMEMVGDAKIPPCKDGYYHFYCSPRLAKHIMQDNQLRDELSRSMTGQRELRKGEIGIYEGFKFFKSNNMSTKTVNTKTAHLGYILGDYVLGCGVGMPAQVRINSNDDYQTKMFLIWLKDCGYTLLDGRLAIEVRTYAP